jgi:excisionase family DNA binding protein
MASVRLEQHEIDAIAEQIVAKLGERPGPGSPGGTVQPRLLTVEQAAVYVGRTKEAVQHLVASRRIPIVRSDRRVFLDVRDLDQWIDANKETGL